MNNGKFIFDAQSDEFFMELEESLVMCDVGVATAERICDILKDKVKSRGIKVPEEITALLKETVAELLRGDSSLDLSKKPSLILVIGVNGAGKTTTIGKLAMRLKDEGKSVVLGAADTFRAAAIDQLGVWAERAGVPMIKSVEGTDPASVVFDTIAAGKARGADVIICDTAGRLHNKINLMNELTKIRNVMGKVIPGAPHEVMLVLDGSTGQNAFEQARQFTQATQVTSLTITKLDGTAKGGVVIGISDQFHIPVRYIGIGEGIDQLRIFDRKEFVKALFGDGSGQS